MNVLVEVNVDGTLLGPVFFFRVVLPPLLLWFLMSGRVSPSRLPVKSFWLRVVRPMAVTKDISVLIIVEVRIVVGMLAGVPWTLANVTLCSRPVLAFLGVCRA